MDSAPHFWPELDSKPSLYLHKLAIHSSFSKKGFGKLALGVTQEHVASNRRECIRSDCDDREALHNLYSGNGFKMVGIVQIQEYGCARYQRLTSQFGTQLPAVSPV